MKELPFRLTDQKIAIMLTAEMSRHALVTHQGPWLARNYLMWHCWMVFQNLNFFLQMELYPSALRLVEQLN